MKFASLSFGAVGDMSRLLEVKGRTGGRNFDFDDNRNCHLVVSPPFAPQLTGCAILAQDENIQYGDFLGPSVDLEYAVQEIQRFRRAAIDLTVNHTPGGTRGMQLADFFLKERLGLSCESAWSDFSWVDLTTAIRHYDAAATFIVDDGVLESLPPEVCAAVVERHPWWSSQVRKATVARAPQLLSQNFAKAFVSRPGIDIKLDAPHELGLGHYLALLALRKQFSTIIRNRVQYEHGRACRDGEVELIAEHYGGERTRRLATYVQGRSDTPNLFDGDEMLVYGVIASIIEGADVVFLTRDPAFMDQLATLASLIGADYVASQFGLRRHADAAHAPNLGGRESSRECGIDVFGQAAALKLGPNWKSEILPLNPYLLNIQCWLLGVPAKHGVRFAVLNYCAERGMHNLLQVKGVTRGRNVDGFHGRNIRAGFSNEAAVVTIWNDRYVPIGSNDFPRDARLDHRVDRLAAADMLRVHMNQEGLSLPWHERP
jgi:hypothetical protein